MCALSQNDLAEMGDIGFHWSDAYVVGCDGTHYTASRRGYPDHYLIATSPQELRVLLRQDYFRWLATLQERMSV